MRFDIITIFPEMFCALTDYGITGRAFTKDLVKAKLWQLRDFADNNYKTIDGSPYGGGAGMILKPEPLQKALLAINGEIGQNPTKTIYLSAGGVRLTQKKAVQLANLPALTVICGRYEGIDQRIIDKYVDEQISVGDFIVSGGELPAMMLLDALIRLVPGVIEKESTQEESFSIFDKQNNQLIEYPQYTRPEEFDGISVPDVLLSGNHKNIKQWRAQKALENTLKYRLDLITKKTSNGN